MFNTLKNVCFVSVLAMAASTAVAVAQETNNLPQSMVWSSYDLGSAGYSEASAIANAVQNKFDTRVRVLPSGTSIGRLLPIKTGRAQFGFLSNEVFFASEGTHEFADPTWGPQEIRVMLGRPASVGLIAAGDLGAEEVEDLRGHRVGFVRGNPALNLKTDAYLAFGGLTRDDVDVVWYGSYGALKDAIIAGQLDAMGMVPTSSLAREIESSSRGMTWLEFPPEDTAGWEAARSLISFAEPIQQAVGAGISEEEPVWMLGYRYPMLTTYADTSEEEVYNLVKAIDESYGLFKDATSQASNWDVSKSIVPPADAPWHEGAIRYAKEQGYWTEEAQQWQEARLSRFEQIQQAWSEAREAFEQSGQPEDEWPTFWDSYRNQHVST
ncbi:MULTISPECIES: TAXI family TRAP transporter solute-binding subunit [Halomonadaceae]|jgi:uncharacterized protein|uniref:TAXI family TRAP transporter solute-binding subunit n=1 Tax=Halomonadaceae TaxID=28256 RepID=UPI0012F0AE77|nr:MULTISPECIES: TAXI family TRAP transporter solute-binding subunit [Halomonas]QNU64303.1 TAXI family TRAP transporter solute-binding subunit [Halomonas titanicae]CAD5258868.1 conserved exported hypothetical protein [Halomonas sp. 59]CAD5259099.1 conserved exported hypothetical protein [Halomonas sp. 113]CAD5273043.1 conserved exported hypothetical protein [Halomonas sp. I3]CAD5289572.1 conserved exported hypothetical protein [Halomonas sp. 156]